MVQRTTCFQGHDLTKPGSVWKSKNGKRRLCKICKNTAQEEYRENSNLSPEDKLPIPTADRAVAKAKRNVKRAREILKTKENDLAQAKAERIQIIKDELFAAAGRLHVNGVSQAGIRAELHRMCDSDAEVEQIADAFFAAKPAVESL
jgi:hypothetical protein